MRSCVFVDKPTNTRIIISTLEIIQPNLFIVVVTTISEGVDCCNLASRRIKLDFRYAPSIVGVSCDSPSILINDSNYIALKILDKVVGNIVVENTANAVLVIVEGNKSIAVPSLAENLGAVKCVSMENAVDLLARSDTVCIVGVFDIIEILELTPLFPFKCMSKIGEGIPLRTYNG